MDMNMINYNYIQQQNEEIFKNLDFLKLNHIILNNSGSSLVTTEGELPWR
jgi:hypothetical protein